MTYHMKIIYLIGESERIKVYTLLQFCYNFARKRLHEATLAINVNYQENTSHESRHSSTTTKHGTRHSFISTFFLRPVKHYLRSHDKILHPHGKMMHPVHPIFCHHITRP